MRRSEVMIYVTGDCHGRYKRFIKKRFPEQLAMTKQDYVIVCGDFGLWDESEEQQFYRKWLETRNFTLLWVDGNHENYDLLKTYEITEWKGGKVQVISPSIIHLMRGQVYEIDGFKIFTFGGARCHDIQGGVLERDDEHLEEKIRELERKRLFYRINHESWWEEEMPSEEERNEGLRNLKRYQNEVDYIITHCAPTSIQNYFSDGDYEVNELTDYFEMLKGTVKFKRWYFGHYHSNRILEEKFRLLYGYIEPLDYEKKKAGEGQKQEESQKEEESKRSEEHQMGEKSKSPEESQVEEEGKSSKESQTEEEYPKSQDGEKSEESQKSGRRQKPIEIPADVIRGGTASSSIAQMIHKGSMQTHAVPKFPAKKEFAQAPPNILFQNPVRLLAKVLFQNPVRPAQNSGKKDEIKDKKEAGNKVENAIETKGTVLDQKQKQEDDKL